MGPACGDLALGPGSGVCRQQTLRRSPPCLDQPCLRRRSLPRVPLASWSVLGAEGAVPTRGANVLSEKYPVTHGQAGVGCSCLKHPHPATSTQRLPQEVLEQQRPALWGR